MKQQKQQIIVVIFFIIGIILVLFSPTMGVSLGNKVISENGGMIDTSEYLLYVENITRSLQIVGGLLSLLSGLLFITYQKKFLV